MSEPKGQAELAELIQKEMDGVLADDEFYELQDRLKADPEALDYYVDTMLSISLLSSHSILSFLEEDVRPLQGSPSDSALWKALAEEEKSAPTLPMPVFEVEKEKKLIEKVQYEKTLRQVNKTSILIAVLSTAALIFLIAYVQLSPRLMPEPVATIIDCFDAQFGGGETYRVGSRLMNRTDFFWLQKGIIEIEFDYGARVVMEAPAQFRLRSAEKMILDAGRLYVKVPGCAKGFMVDTPSSSIIDLGTEFGIKVDVDGTTDVHMYRGKASLIPGTKGQTGESQELTAGQARRVDLGGLVREIPTGESLFVRAFDSARGFIWKGRRFDLADVVGGGSGFGTGRLNWGINPLTGKPEPFTKATGFIEGKPGYMPVPSVPLIDGVFIPDGGEPVQVSSENHIFADCPSTNGGFWGGVFNGAWHEADTIKVPRHSLRLGGRSYGTAGTSSIYMHANQGITFDLHAIRDSAPGLNIESFTARCGVSETLYDYASVLRVWKGGWKALGPEDSKADFYVLVDSRIRFAARDVTAADKALPVQVSLTAEDRFLTLVTTQGSDEWNNTNDWTLFAEPYLTLSE